MEHLQYPIGRFPLKQNYSDQDIAHFIDTMENAPAKYSTLVESCAEEDLTRTYRPGSWTVRQLVHHVADIQLLNFLRFKKTLTEEDYVATVIDMNGWAETPDARIAPVQSSLTMFESISQRFIFLVMNLDEDTLTKSYYHPVRQFHLNLKQALHMAVWHIEHHQAHIEIALEINKITPDYISLEEK